MCELNHSQLCHLRLKTQPNATLAKWHRDGPSLHLPVAASRQSLQPLPRLLVGANTRAWSMRPLRPKCLVNVTTRESGKNQVWAPISRFLMVYAPIGGTSRCPAVCTVQSETSLLHCDRSMMHIGTGQQTTACDSSTASSIYVDTYTYQLQYNFNLCMHAGPS